MFAIETLLIYDINIYILRGIKLIFIFMLYYEILLDLVWIVLIFLFHVSFQERYIILFYSWFLSPKETARLYICQCGVIL